MDPQQNDRFKMMLRNAELNNQQHGSLLSNPYVRNMFNLANFGSPLPGSKGPQSRPGGFNGPVRQPPNTDNRRGYMWSGRGSR